MKLVYGKRAITVFLVLVVILSAIVETIYCMGGTDDLIALLMWMPALSAFIASIVSMKENNEQLSLKTLLSRLSIRGSKLRFILHGALIPFVYLLIPYLFYWHKYPENFGYSGAPFSLILKDLGVYTIVMVFVGMATATGEEIGWRGFMVPSFLEPFGWKKTLIYTSLFWSLWHFPLLIFGGYMEGTPLWYRLSAFTLCVVPVGILAGILRLESGSIWPAAFLHAAHNAYDQAVFGFITKGDNRFFYVSETGILTIICAWILALVALALYSRRLRGEKKALS